MPPCVFNKTSGEFCRVDFGCDAATEVIVHFPLQPDRRIQKLDLNAQQVVDKSQAEIDAWDASRVQDNAIRELDNVKALKALAMVLAQSTGQTISQVRTAFIAAYKSL